MILKYTQALHQAVYAKHFECVELLLSPPWFADRFAQNNKYVTPGQLAVSLAAAEDGGCAATQDTHLQSFDSFTLT